MKKLLASLLMIAGACTAAWAGGKTTGFTEPAYTDNGDKISGFAVNVGSTTPVLVYTGSTLHREVLIQPDKAFAVYLATHTNFTATSGTRWKVPSGGSWTTNSHPGSIYALYEAAAGAGGDVIGEIEYDTADKR